MAAGRICSLLAVACLVVFAQQAAAYTPTKSSNAGQLSPAVLLMGEFDWMLYTGSDGRPWSRCLDMVWQARKQSNGDRLNFVPTHHWLPNSNGLGVASFCYMHTSGAGDRGTCMAWTADKLAEFKRSMTYCFTEAFKQGFVPYVRPHLDDGLNRGVWRNSLLFSPTTKYSGYSYADVMTTPLAEAMRDALAAASKLGKLYTPPDANRPVVYMGLQGEMSATLMRYTSDWATLIPLIKSTIGSTLADVKVGVGLNFNALDAVETLATASQGSSILSVLLGGGSTGGSNPSAPSIQAANVNDLLSNKVDFLGISAYAPYSGANFATSEFQNAAFNVGDSLASLANGLSLSSLVSTGRLELHYSEFGIGGGVNGNAQISPSADNAAKQPWAGISGAYTTSLDPWRQGFLSAFRSSFYIKALDWLSSPSSTYTYKVDQVFVWCMASWDVFGLYPDSRTTAGTYRDPSIVNRIAAHNSAVIAAQVCAKGTAECNAYYKANAACLNDPSGAACLDRSSTSTTNPDVVTESGPAQASSPSPSPTPGASPVPSDGSAPPSSGSVGGSNATDASNSTGLDMAPGSSSAASPDTTTIIGPNTVFVGTIKPANTTKSGALLGSRVLLLVSALFPVMCAFVLGA